MATSPERAVARRVRGLLALAVAAPVVVVGLLLAQGGWRSDVHGAFISRVLFAADRGQLQLLGFQYPPLPFLLLLPSPTDAWAITLGGLAVFGLAWMVLEECHLQRSMLALVLLVAALWTPIGVHFVVGDFNEAVGLLALLIGWRNYRRWWETRQTVHGLYTGLWLGIAFYTSPLGLALGLVAGALLPLIFPRLQIPPFASQLVLLIFPGIAATATWAYLSWIFTGQVAFPFHPWEPSSPPLLTVLRWTVPYLLVAVLALLRPRATTAGMLLPLLLLAIANRIGWEYSLAFAVGLLTLVAIVALPQAMSPAVRALVAATAVVQALAAWVWVPFPQQTADDRAAHAIATAMASAPARSILVDDRYAAGVLKWAPSMAPYLTTRDAGYEIALADPRRVVEYALVTPDDDGLTLDADVRDLPGMVEDWSWNGYTLYRRTDAPRINVRYDALMEASANGSRR